MVTKKKVTKKKASKKKVSKKAVAKKEPKRKVVEVEVAKTEKEIATELREQCRDAYGDFQKSWFEFAKLVTEIHDSNAWEQLDFATFKEYCVEEFRDLNYSTIVKFVGIMTSKIGQLITGKVEKEPKAKLPAWETCYQLKVSEDKFPKEEMPKLYKDVIDGKVSVREIRQKIKDVTFTDRVTGKLEDVGDDEVFQDADVVDAEIEESIDPLTVQVDACINEAKLLITGLPVITDKLEEGSEKTVELAELLYEKLIPAVNEYIDQVEELTSIEEDEDGYEEDEDED